MLANASNNAVDLLTDIARRSTNLSEGTSDDRRRRWGQFYSPPAVARFMAAFLRDRPSGDVRVLDPGAGTGILGIAAAQDLLARGAKRVHLVAIEPEHSARACLDESLEIARSALGSRFSCQLLDVDMLHLDELGAPVLRPFDVAISNPPYFKMPPSDRRGGGSPNIYTRFMEICATLLKPEGELCFVIPRSFASGLYFRTFRRAFHRDMDLEATHVFQSRRKAFREYRVIQENIIVRYRKGAAPSRDVSITSSSGPADFSDCTRLTVRRDEIIDTSDESSLLFLPTGNDDLAVMRTVRSWDHNLERCDLKISTGPVVPFRARDVLRKQSRQRSTVPLLWMQHVRADGVSWPLGARFRKEEYIRADAGPKLLIPNRNYVLLRRFSSKEQHRRLTAAVLSAGKLPGETVGLENHLNFIHRPGREFKLAEATGVAALLNSALLDRYFRITNGNTQVNATDIRAMPFPSLEAIFRIGGRASGLGGSARAIGEILGVEEG